MNSRIVSLLRSMRLPFLVLTFSCVLLGYCSAASESGGFSPVSGLLVLLGAVFAHLSVNLLNEYHDFQSGLDALTVRTPFSGGSGALIDDPGSLPLIRSAALSSLLVTLAVGVYFLFASGLQLLPLGITGVLIILAYTQWINRHPFLCLISPGLAFGPLMVVGTHLVLTGNWSVSAFWLSLVPFFLVNNLLLLNQFPDIAADRKVGRNHFPIAFGLRISLLVYTLFSLAAGLVIVLGLFMGLYVPAAAIALLPILLQLGSIPALYRQMECTQAIIPYMGINVLTANIAPLMLGLAVLLFERP